MIVTSTAEAVPYTPEWLKGQKGAPVIYLRAGSVIERGQMEAELAGPHRAGQVYGYELRQAVRSGVLALLEDDPELDRLLGLIEAEGEGEAEALSASDRQLLVGVRNILAESWPEYRELVAQLERRRAIAPIVALKRFCVGMDVPNITFERDRDGLVKDATLAQLEPLLLTLAGNKAYELQLPRGQEGNSPRPSPSDASPKPSSSDVTSTADGKSAPPSGRKTRASRSPRGSGRS